MVFTDISKALRYCRGFHRHFGSPGYSYKATPNLFGRGFRIAIYNARGLYLTYL